MRVPIQFESEEYFTPEIKVIALDVDKLLASMESILENTLSIISIQCERHA